MNASTILLRFILLSALLAGCSNEDIVVAKPPKMSDNTYLTMPIAPSTTNTPISPISPIGTEPAGQTKEAPATTSSSKSDVSKRDQSAAMPLTGQANDHSAVVPKSTKFPPTAP